MPVVGSVKEKVLGVVLVAFLTASESLPPSSMTYVASSSNISRTSSAAGTVTVIFCVPVYLLPSMVVSAVIVAVPPDLAVSVTEEPVRLFSVTTSLPSVTVQLTV